MGPRASCAGLARCAADADAPHRPAGHRDERVVDRADQRDRHVRFRPALRCRHRVGLRIRGTDHRGGRVDRECRGTGTGAHERRWHRSRGALLCRVGISQSRGSEWQPSLPETRWLRGARLWRRSPVEWDWMERGRAQHVLCSTRCEDPWIASSTTWGRAGRAGGDRSSCSPARWGYPTVSVSTRRITSGWRSGGRVGSLLCSHGRAAADRTRAMPEHHRVSFWRRRRCHAVHHQCGDRRCGKPGGRKALRVSCGHEGREHCSIR